MPGRTIPFKEANVKHVGFDANNVYLMYACLRKKRRGESTMDIDFEVQIFIDKSNKTDSVPERHRFGVGCCLYGKIELFMLNLAGSWGVGCVS